MMHKGWGEKHEEVFLRLNFLLTISSQDNYVVVYGEDCRIKKHGKYYFILFFSHNNAVKFHSVNYRGKKM
jgi:hypothetical protein